MSAAPRPAPPAPAPLGHALVLAKAPVPGRVKTRLAVDVGDVAAAEVAAAALVDTIVACTAAFGSRHCHLALDGDLADGLLPDRLTALVTGWRITPQHGDGLDARLAHAHASTPGPLVQVGMDTPQATPELLRGAARGLARHDAVLGPADDGGWWVLALRDGTAAAALRGVPMSTPHTHNDTRVALTAAGLDVGTTTRLRDVDTVADAEEVAALVPDSAFGRAWARITGAAA
ncbi:DUF2064 domain-containing protein [Nocardioides sp. SYSU D00038]|uniref:TIGR04282 family arsenosugar biosynthesis glycosyltransferase n=1 Tax=Nocardioides sp. SYSU D00038 TaxID=2812554 RepID=UPI0027DC3EBE|nr:DUF2064 domain-containing protein [Nocardioides sp. SYSU D00038]